MQTPLRKMRIAQNMTIQEVATAMEMDVGNLSRIERGAQATSLATAEKLSKFFGGAINEMQILYPKLFSAPDENTERN